MTIEADIGHALPIAAFQFHALTAAVQDRAPRPNLRLERSRTDTGEPYVLVSRVKLPARVKHPNPTNGTVWWEIIPRDEMLAFLLRVENGWQVFALDGEPFRTLASVEEVAEFIGSLEGPILIGAPL
jgi:hypothetical protein